MRIFFFLLGFGLMTIGSTYIITYLNLFTFGYSIKEFLIFLLSRYECYYILIGLIIITIVIYWKGENNDLHI